MIDLSHLTPSTLICIGVCLGVFTGGPVAFLTATLFASRARSKPPVIGSRIQRRRPAPGIPDYRDKDGINRLFRHLHRGSR